MVAEPLHGALENRAVAEQPVSADIEGEPQSCLTCGILCFEFGRSTTTAAGIQAERVNR